MRFSPRLGVTAFLLAAAASVVACSAAPAAEEVADDEGAQTAGTPGVDPDSAYEDIPASQPSSICVNNVVKAVTIKDEEPITSAPDEDFLSDVTGTPATPYDVTKYVASRGKPVRKFAAATVLAAMRRMRRYYFTKPYTAGYRSVTAIGAHPAGEAESCQPTLNAPWDDCQFMYNTTSDGRTGNNMALMPAFWSDVQAHFFTMAPHFRHACWTAGFQYAGLKAAIGSTPAGCDPKSNIREVIADACSGKPIKCGNWAGAMPYVMPNFSAINIMWVNPKTHKFVPLPEDIRTEVPAAALGTTPADIPKFKAAIFAEAQRKAGNVNVFDYIMRASLFAFDFDQQQAVLNAFYADDKKAFGDATPFDPCNQVECGTWRPKRKGDSDPQDNTHCRSDKLVPPDVKSVGPWQ